MRHPSASALHSVGSRMCRAQALASLGRCRPAYVFIYTDQSAVLPHHWLRLEWRGAGMCSLKCFFLFFFLPATMTSLSACTSVCVCIVTLAGGDGEQQPDQLDQNHRNLLPSLARTSALSLSIYHSLSLSPSRARTQKYTS